MAAIVAPLKIVGAGPAGLAAALTMRRAGVPVVVYERNTDIGLRFHGDFQGIENWTTDGDVLEELAKYGIDLNLTTVPFREVVCFGPDGRERLLRSRRPLFYLVRRGMGEDTLDQALKRQALAAGVEIRLGSVLGQLAGRGIVTGGPHRGDVIASGYLFATDMADGAYAAVSQRLAPGGYAYIDLRSWMRHTYAPMFWKRMLYPLARLRRTAPSQPHEGCDCTWCRCVRDGGACLLSEKA